MKNIYKVFINPGHAPNGDPDPGACGNNLRECDVTLAVGQKLQAQLEERGYTVSLLQDDDLCKVCDSANAAQANAFISIHCDSFTSESAHGTSVFWYGGSSQGEKLGKLIRTNIVKKLGTDERSNHDGSHFYVCKHTAMPSVLVELAFISNRDDASKLATKQTQFAMAIADAVDEFFK